MYLLTWQRPNFIYNLHCQVDSIVMTCARLSTQSSVIPNNMDNIWAAHTYKRQVQIVPTQDGAGGEAGGGGYTGHGFVIVRGPRCQHGELSDLRHTHTQLPPTEAQARALIYTQTSLNNRPTKAYHPN